VFANINNNTTIKNNLAAFVQCFDTGTAPAVGYTRTVSSTNVASTSISNDWSLLEFQAAAGNIDLIVKGTVDGKIRGLVYQPGSANYRPDTTNLTTLTRAQLTTKIQNGDRLSIMGVPPGSGVRMGIDRDEDGLLDGDVPPPSLNIARNSNGAIVNWPLSAAGYDLQSADSLSSIWSNAPDAIEILGNQNYVTNALPAANRFFRLKSSQ
jgi:hypothetical protein